MEPREQQFYQALYQDCSEAQINLRAIGQSGATTSQLIPLDGNSMDQMEAYVERYDTEQYIGVYYAVATRNGGGRKEHIVEIPALWVEIDFKHTLEEDARKRLGEFYFTPSAVISSGGGLHVYWFLNEPATKADIPEVESTLRQLVNALEAEPEATDASRILRIPGTYNRKKDYDTPREVRLLYCHPEKRYNFEDIGDFLPKAPDYTPEPTPDTERGSEIDRVMQCKFVQHCDEDRADLPEPEWYCMISNLARCQGGPSKIHELSRGHPGYSQEETNRKILHAIDAANPHTCNYIKRLWPCGTDCGVKAPAALVHKGVVVHEEPLSPADTCIIDFVTTEPPPREYVLDELLPRHVVGGIIGMGGTSKGFLVITLSLGLATGRTVLDRFIPSRAFRVLALLGEDPTDELHRRTYNTAHYLFRNMDEETQGLIRKNLGIKSVLGEVNDLMTSYEGERLRTARYDWLRQSVEAHESEILIIDPKSQFYGLDELSNEDNSAWVNTLGSFVQDYRMNVLFTHHASQSMRDEFHQMAARGGTALPDGARWMAHLRLIRETEAKKYEIENRKDYVEFDVSKNNYARAFPRTLFFKRGPEGVLMPVNLEAKKLREVAEVIVKELATAYAEDHDPLTRRELADRTEGKDLRDLIKSKFKKCTNKDILAAIDHAIEEGLLTTEERKSPKGKARECLWIPDEK
jgi:replicative DNA helicase